MKQLKVKITKKHIKNGLRRNAQSCPIALAIRDTKKFNVYSVNTYDTIVYDDHYRYTLKPSAKATEFIRNFDLGLAVEECTVIFTVRDEYQINAF
jgi:hypothetical protein